MNTKKYNFAVLKKMDLNSLYDGSAATLKALDDNLVSIINTEASITLNLVKARLREAFNVAKISQKALDIINEILENLGVIKTDNLFDVVLWPQTGIFDLDAFRVNSDRLIYDIPYQEMIILFNEYDLKKEELYRAILAYFDLQVLTKKAENYLSFVESKL